MVFRIGSINLNRTHYVEAAPLYSIIAIFTGSE